MGKMVTIGAGAMGTAFAYPCSDNKHDVSIVGTHLENNAIDELNKWQEVYPDVDVFDVEQLGGRRRKK